MFLANYGDGLSDVPLPDMLDRFRESSAIAACLRASFDVVYAVVRGGERNSSTNSH